MYSLSVLICVHSNTDINDSFLIDAIDSLNNQTYRNFETVLVLDQCWNKTRKKLEDRGMVKDFTLIERGKKEGLALAKNHGLSVVKTDWVAYLDADDLYEPQKIEKQLHYIKSNAVDFLGTHAWNITGKDRKTKRPSGFNEHHYNKHEDIVRVLPHTNVLTHGSMMIRMSSLKDLGYYNNVKGMEDYDLWKRASKSYRFFQLPERLYVLSMDTSVAR